MKRRCFQKHVKNDSNILNHQNQSPCHLTLFGTPPWLAQQLNALILQTLFLPVLLPEISPPY
jgi:hypothetical protein